MGRQRLNARHLERTRGTARRRSVPERLCNVSLTVLMPAEPFYTALQFTGTRMNQRKPYRRVLGAALR
jgi:hypothetical protein